jgi:3-methylfumaryl-CoA hydratase
MTQENFENWIAKTKTIEGLLTADLANKMNVTLNRDALFQDGDELPLLWHWMYFHELVRRDHLGIDGHEELGEFLPPVPLPHRMWAGGKLQFMRPLRLGEKASKRSRIQSISHKEGRSGSLYFVIVEHEISVAGELCISEEQTLVYREAPKPDEGNQQQAKLAPGDAKFSGEIVPDPIFLFRYSALTFNSHRIHYDVDYCRKEEGYPNLVVHGPLNATLLIDLFSRQFSSESIVAYDYRGVSPVFLPHPYSLNGKREGNRGEGWIADKDGGLVMSATVTFA